MADVDERADSGDLLDCYLGLLRNAGMDVGQPLVSVARSFVQRIGRTGWSAMQLAEQFELPGKSASHARRDRRLRCRHRRRADHHGQPLGAIGHAPVLGAVAER